MADNGAEQLAVQELQRRRALFLDYVETFGTEAGRRVLEDMKVTAFFTTTTAGRSSQVAIDPFRMAWNEGARGFMLAVLDKIHKGQHPAEDRPSHAERGVHA